MQINRLFEIVYLLLEKEQLTAAFLAERFEVSTRTIYRDIEALSEAGIPVYMSKGRGGGISLLPDFALNKAVFTEDEKNEILSSLKAVAALNLSGQNQVSQKVSSFLGDSSTDWIEIDFTSWTNLSEEASLFTTLKEAILNRQLLSFSYLDGKGTSSIRTAEPLKLCFKGYAWYLYAWCRIREDYRFFKLARIRKLSILEEHFQRPTPSKVFSDKDHFQPEPIKVTLKIAPKMAFRIYEEFENAKKLPDGSFLAELFIPGMDWLYYYLSTYGNTCEILSPPEIRTRVKDHFQGIVNINS